jgi:hypothetical protein
MFTDAEAVSDFGWATHSAAAPHTAADAYGLAASNSGASTVSHDCPSDR